MNEGTRKWINRWVKGDLTWRRFASSVAFIYGSLCVMGLFADRLLFQPHAPGYADGPGILKLTTRGGPRISARVDAASNARFTVIYSHGNAEDLEDGAWLVPRLQRLGVSLVRYDYEGYGTSEGKPSEARLYADIDAVYEHVTGAMGVPPERVILHGRSLGGGPTVDLASRRPVGGVILESTFMSAFRVPFGVRLLPWDELDSLAKMPKVRCPVLVMHGTDDRLISVKHGRALFDAASGPKRSAWVVGAGHNDLPWVFGAGYDRALADFFSLVLGG